MEAAHEENLWAYENAPDQNSNFIYGNTRRKRLEQMRASTCGNAEKER